MSQKEIVKLNDVVSNVTEFSIYRTRDNLIRPVFIIYSTNKDKIKKVLEYLTNWISKPIKKISIDMLDKFKMEDISKQHVYVFNMSKQEIIKEESMIKNSNVDVVVSSSIYNVIVDKAGPLIFISDNRFGVPTIFTSIASAMFIDDIKAWNHMVRLNPQYDYEKEDILVIDYMNSTNRLSLLKEF